MPNPSTIAESEAEIAALKAENDRLLAIIKTKNELIERLTLQLLGVK